MLTTILYLLQQNLNQHQYDLASWMYLSYIPFSSLILTWWMECSLAFHRCLTLLPSFSHRKTCLLFVQTEENTLMKEVLGKMKNSKEKNMCWQDGRLFEDKEAWVVDSCTKCTCQVLHSQMKLWLWQLYCGCHGKSLLIPGDRSLRLCATKLPAPQWPVPALRLWTANAAPCVYVSIPISQCLNTILCMEGSIVHIRTEIEYSSIVPASWPGT